MLPNPKETVDLVTFTDEIFSEQLRFLYSGSRNYEFQTLHLRCLTECRLRGWCNLVLFMFLLSLKCPAGNYIFKVNNRNTRTMREICSKLTIFIVNFEYISHLVLVFLLLTLSR